MALLIIRDLTHWAAWEDLSLIWTHKYSLPEGGHVFVVYSSIGAICIVAFNGDKKVVVDVAWTL